MHKNKYNVPNTLLTQYLVIAAFPRKETYVKGNDKIYEEKRITTPRQYKTQIICSFTERGTK